MDRRLYERALRAAINVVKPNVKKGEEVAIIGSTDVDQDFYKVLMNAAYICEAAEVSIALMSARKGPGNPAPKSIHEAMKTADVVFGVASTSLAFSDSPMECLKAGHKWISFPVPPGKKKAIDMLLPLRIYNIDRLQELKKITLKVKEVLTGGKNVRIVTSKGTDITVSIEGFRGVAYYGIADEDAARNGSWPPSEAHVASRENTAEGIVIVDGFVSGIGPLTDPVELKFERGQLVNIRGGIESDRIKKIVESNKNADKFCEVGIGTNKYIGISGTNGDKKVWGTAHIAVGNSASVAFGGVNFSGTIESDIHMDFHFKPPAVVEIDGIAIVNEGKLLI